MSATSTPLDRRAVLKGLAGVTLALLVLEAMGQEVAAKTPWRFCAMDTANGMSLPNPKHGIDEWSWFPKTDGRAFEFGKSTEPLRPFREQRRGLPTESCQRWQPVRCVENRRGTNRTAFAIITA